MGSVKGRTISQKKLERFEASKRRKEIFAQFVADKRLGGKGFVAGLARELGVDGARLSKALTLERLDERIGDSSYVFSAPLARKVEYALFMPIRYLEGEDMESAVEPSEDRRQLIALAHQHLSGQFIDAYGGLRLEYLGAHDMFDCADPFRIDLQLVDRQGTPLLLCNAYPNHIKKGTPAYKNELASLVAVAYDRQVPYCIIATLEGTTMRSRKLAIDCRRVKPGESHSSIALPTVEEIMKAAAPY